MGSFEKKIKMAFKAMDTDGSGFLELDELENALKSVGGFTESEVRAIAKVRYLYCILTHIGTSMGHIPYRYTKDWGHLD